MNKPREAKREAIGTLEPKQEPKMRHQNTHLGAMGSVKDGKIVPLLVMLAWQAYSGGVKELLQLADSGQIGQQKSRLCSQRAKIAPITRPARSYDANRSSFSGF
jgi:hypothetical protein